MADANQIDLQNKMHSHWYFKPLTFIHCCRYYSYYDIYRDYRSGLKALGGYYKRLSCQLRFSLRRTLEAVINLSSRVTYKSAPLKRAAFDCNARTGVSPYFICVFAEACQAAFRSSGFHPFFEGDVSLVRDLQDRWNNSSRLPADERNGKWGTRDLRMSIGVSSG